MSEPLAAWSPNLRVYLRRCALAGVTTAAALALFGWGVAQSTGYWPLIYIAPILSLLYSFGVDDPTRWRAIRQNRWYLRTDAVIHHGPDGEVRIPMADITDVRTRLGWSVVLFLKDRQRVCIAYVPEPASIAAQILAARARLLP
ncbi:hypothetical protein GGR95_000817 [Sulfitobacter undariae]|uniref:YcxB-like protein n=1 Tax=Sulfitobacter undariae TaxID=1563671 RepID=A0A7W6E2Q6_9RHOB|nr:hypothetical protein [Sulfitobacter undariae]MBB3993189.1 hypothetical protein [Sulfitobacter undariae]